MLHNVTFEIVSPLSGSIKHLFATTISDAGSLAYLDAGKPLSISGIRETSANIETSTLPQEADETDGETPSNGDSPLQPGVPPQTDTKRVVRQCKTPYCHVSHVHDSLQTLLWAVRPLVYQLQSPPGL